jgi:hypothetical protein
MRHGSGIPLMTHDDEPRLTAEEAAMVEADCARDAALRSLIADALALIACRDPASVSRIRDAARHYQTGAELGAFKPQPGMDWLAYHTERHALLEHACGAAGYPHKGADVLAWRRPVEREPFNGPGQVLAFSRR